MEHTHENKMGTAPVLKLVLTMSLPAMFSMLVQALYNIVDQIFIANADYLRSHGNAANTVVFPLTVVALAVAVMVGDGCCAFVSMALGRSDRQRACRSVGNAVVLTVAASLVLTAVYLIFADGIIATAKKEGRNDPVRHAERVNRIVDHWDEILKIMDEELPPFKTIVDIMTGCGMPMRPADLGICDDDVRDALKASRDIRNKYLSSTMLWDLGLLYDMADQFDGQ